MANNQFIATKECLLDHHHVVLMTTGSVISIKTPLIVIELLQYYWNVKVEVIATKELLAFYNPSDVVKAGGRVWTDKDEWLGSYKISDPILHIQLRRWADIVLVAPCSANTLSKIAYRLCDNLATPLLRALAPSTLTYIFPAMKTLMYKHLLTAEHVCIARDVVQYQAVGLGAMTEWRDIVKIVVDQMELVTLLARSYE
ncbi:flavoprotein-domain-containing protein [Suillus paluster]|uniref:flavoprotein-domain-containing protein n=1 Tax=Suillus paluster TaxID=48578 RepID=UPI001B87CBC7|nr:flavoprotein-domain-containing protein [Suillus paluster]KAG1743174.1 flavoprotein-domain-containing protein [Suillus paluster]